MRIGDGWDVDIYKAMILAVEEDAMGLFQPEVLRALDTMNMNQVPKYVTQAARRFCSDPRRRAGPHLHRVRPRSHGACRQSIETFFTYEELRQISCSPRTR